MKKLIQGIAVAALMAWGGIAQAQLTQYYQAQQGGVADPAGPVLKVVSTVTGAYDYSYTFTLGYGTGLSFVAETSANELYQFSVGGINPAIISAVTGGFTHYTTSDSIVWLFTGVYTGTVSFDSPLPPGTVFGGGADGSINWTGKTQGPVPVPEPTTVLAGALMLLPLGVGAFRAIRKDRVA